MAVKAAALAPLRDDGEVRLGHEAHEQQDVDVARLAARERQTEQGGGKNSKRERPGYYAKSFNTFRQRTEYKYSPQNLHFVPEGLQLLRRWLGHFQDLDGHIAVPLALKDGPERAGADALLHGHLVRRHLPVVARVSVTLENPNHAV